MRELYRRAGDISTRSQAEPANAQKEAQPPVLQGYILGLDITDKEREAAPLKRGFQAGASQPEIPVGAVSVGGNAPTICARD